MVRGALRVSTASSNQTPLNLSMQHALRRAPISRKVRKPLSTTPELLAMPLGQQIWQDRLRVVKVEVVPTLRLDVVTELPEATIPNFPAQQCLTAMIWLKRSGRKRASFACLHEFFP